MHTSDSNVGRYKDRIKWTLHSKLARNFLADLKVCILENFYNENDLDWCRRYLDILGRNLLKDAYI